MGMGNVSNLLNAIHKFHEVVPFFKIKKSMGDTGTLSCYKDYVRGSKEDIEWLETCLKKGLCIMCEKEESEVFNLPCKCVLLCIKCVFEFLRIGKYWCVCCMDQITDLQFSEDKSFQTHPKIFNIRTYMKDLDMNIYYQICLKENCCFCCCKGTLEVSNMPCAHKFWSWDCISSFLTKGRPDCILCGVEVEGFIYQDKNYTFIFKEGKDKGHDFLNKKLISELGLPFVNKREVLAAFFDPCRKGLCLNCNKMEANFVNVPCNCKIFCEKCNELFFCRVDAYTGRRECCRSVVPKQCCKVIKKCKCLVCGDEVENTKRVEVSSVKQENNHLLEFLVTKPRKIKRKHVEVDWDYFLSRSDG